MGGGELQRGGGWCDKIVFLIKFKFSKILGTGKENQIFILRTPATVKLFHQIVRKMILWCKKKKIITHSNGFV